MGIARREAMSIQRSKPPSATGIGEHHPSKAEQGVRHTTASTLRSPPAATRTDEVANVLGGRDLEGQWSLLRDLFEHDCIAPPSPVQDPNGDRPWMRDRPDGRQADFDWKPSGTLSLLSWSRDSATAPWWGSRDNPAIEPSGPPYSVDAKQRFLRLLERLVTGDWQCYALRSDEVPRYVTTLAELEGLRRLDPGAFAAKLRDDPIFKSAYEAYPKKATSPSVLNGPGGVGQATVTDYFVVPELQTVYAQKDQTWYALPFEAEMIRAQPGLAELTRGVEVARLALESREPISEVTRNTRAVVQHASQPHLWSKPAADTPPAQEFQRGLARFVDAFAKNAEALLQLAETDPMKRELGGVAASLGTLGRNVAQFLSPGSISQLEALRSRVVPDLASRR